MIGWQAHQQWEDKTIVAVLLERVHLFAPGSQLEGGWSSQARKTFYHEMHRQSTGTQGKHENGNQWQPEAGRAILA